MSDDGFAAWSGSRQLRQTRARAGTGSAALRPRRAADQQRRGRGGAGGPPDVLPFHLRGGRRPLGAGGRRRRRQRVLQRTSHRSRGGGGGSDRLRRVRPPGGRRSSALGAAEAVQPRRPGETHGRRRRRRWRWSGAVASGGRGALLRSTTVRPDDAISAGERAGYVGEPRRRAGDRGYGQGVSAVPAGVRLPVAPPHGLEPRRRMCSLRWRRVPAGARTTGAVQAGPAGRQARPRDGATHGRRHDGGGGR